MTIKWLGVPAAGHVANGFWHAGRVRTCPRCKPLKKVEATNVIPLQRDRRGKA